MWNWMSLVLGERETETERQRQRQKQVRRKSLLSPNGGVQPQAEHTGNPVGNHVLLLERGWTRSDSRRW